MLKLKVDRWPRGRNSHILIGTKDEAKEEDSQDPWGPSKHAALEMLASVIVSYSAIYIPLSESDHLRQYVGAICIFTVVMTLKDSQYFCPDSTPLATLMLWAATLYTDIKGDTRTYDIIARVIGQLLGWGLVFAIAATNKDNLKTYTAIPSFDTNSTDPLRSTEGVHAVQEGLGTLLECIAITFAIIPLMSPYPLDNSENNEGIESKLEAEPPSMGRLALVALSLASIHYTLERLFQATMNPLATLLQLYIRDDLRSWPGPIFGQLVGALLAVAYVKWCSPTRGTLRKIIEQREREYGRRK